MRSVGISLDKQVERWAKKVERSVTRVEYRKLLKEAAKPLKDTMKANVPVTSRQAPVKRYDKQGNVVAEYHRGNLRRSIKILNLEKPKKNSWRPAGVYVGTKLRKGNSTGTFKGNRVDGYYAHFVNDGHSNSKKPPSRFLERSVQSEKENVKRILGRVFLRELQGNIKRNGLKGRI